MLKGRPIPPTQFSPRVSLPHQGVNPLSHQGLTGFARPIPARNTNCVMCMQSCSIQMRYAKVAGCNHIMHEKCASRWADKGNTCPQCRAPISKMWCYKPDADEHYKTVTYHRQRPQTSGDTEIAARLSGA